MAAGWKPVLVKAAVKSSACLWESRGHSPKLVKTERCQLIWRTNSNIHTMTDRPKQALDLWAMRRQEIPPAKINTPCVSPRDAPSYSSAATAASQSHPSAQAVTEQIFGVDHTLAAPHSWETRADSPYRCLGRWPWTPASVLPSPFSTTQPNSKIPLDWHASSGKTRGAGAVKRRNVLGAPSPSLWSPRGLWPSLLKGFRVPINPWPYKGPQLPRHERSGYVEGWHRVKVTPEPRRRPVPGQGRSVERLEGSQEQGSRECIRTRPAALISLLPKNVWGMTPDRDSRYQSCLVLVYTANLLCWTWTPN